MPLERFHDYPLDKFQVQNPILGQDPRGAKREREITLLPLRPDLQEDAIGIDPKSWAGVLWLARQQNFVLPTDDLTPPLAHDLAKALKAGLEQLDRLRLAIDRTLDVCKRQRGLRVGWRFLED